MHPGRSSSSAPFLAQRMDRDVTERSAFAVGDDLGSGGLGLLEAAIASRRSPDKDVSIESLDLNILPSAKARSTSNLEGDTNCQILTPFTDNNMSHHHHLVSLEYSGVSQAYKQLE